MFSPASMPASPPVRQPGAAWPRARQARSWLQAPGSLTRHLAQAIGPVQVEVLQQGAAPLWPEEARALQHGRFRHGGVAHVRTVVLWCTLPDGRPWPAVLARSAVLAPHARLRWSGLRGLGRSPLAQLLYDTPRIRRSPLVAQRDAPASPAARHVLRLWPRPADPTPPLPPRAVWRRSSVFVRAQAPLIVTEWFAPGVWDSSVAARQSQ